MKRHFTAAALAAACIVAPADVGAQTNTPPYTTPAEVVTLQQWANHVSHELDRTLHYPELIGGQPFATGIVKVKFNCSDSGQPADVALLDSSGSHALDRAALAAVRKIATLHPLPNGMRHDQQFAAVLIFETDRDRYEAAERKVREDARKANAWFKGTSVAAAQSGPILIAAR